MELMHLYENLGEWYHSRTGISHRMNKKLDKELLALLFRQAPMVSISLYALLGVALYFLWDELPRQVLLLWGGVNFVLSSLLLLGCWLYRRAGDIESPDRWINGYTYLTLLQDIAWGAIGPLSFTIGNPFYELLTLFMLAGMTAGGLITRGVVFRIYIVSSLSLLTPIIITLALRGEPLSEAMLVLTLIYLVFMLSVAKNYSGSIRKNFLLWLDNEKLVQELRRSNSQVEDANRGLTREIERRREVEAELLQAKERAEQASEAKNQFLASVSHELRTPLNGIIGFTAILDKATLEGKLKGYVGQIGKSANNLLRLVNDILDITAIEAGHLKLHEAPFSLRTEMGEVAAILQPMAERKNLGLTSRIDDDVPDVVHGDADRLRQVISNLLSNALKYTDKGDVSLHIGLLHGGDETIVLEFVVTDSGIGIPDSALATLFDNFTRVEGFESHHNEGVGLGLAIVKNLLAEMHGQIRVESEPGQGSRFTVELPFVRGSELPPRRAAQHPVDQAPLQRLKVLVVDDNEINRRVLTAFLEQWGVSCVEAASGEQTLALVQAQPFDVVLLDIQMPDISGIEVARRMRASGLGDMRLIAVTAHAFPEQREAILEAGFNDFIIKPVAEEALYEALSRVEA